MARSKSPSGATRVKQLPWPAIAGGAIAVARRWRALSQKERSRLLELGRRPFSLSTKERRELQKLARKLDLRGMAGDISKLARAAARRRRRS